MPSNFFLLSLLLCSSIVAYGVPSPAEAPHPPPPPHHGHHNKHHSPPPPPPSHPPPPPPPRRHPPPPPSPPPPSHPPPTPPPAHPPVKPPTYPPVKPPSYPPLRKKVAVQGVVYCKSCKYRGRNDGLGLGATPILGAVVKLQCNNTKDGNEDTTKTDKNGYFFLLAKRLTTSGFHKCKVSLVSSPLLGCGVATNLHGGVAGAPLIPAKTNKTLPYQLFSVGPFAFEPHKKLPCHY